MYKELLSEKQYLKNLSANVITRFGDGIDTIVFAWLVLQITGSASITAITFGINGIPNILFGLISGVAASYYPKKIIMFICDIGRGVMSIITAFLYINGALEVWHIFLITFINSSFESFREPAAVSVTPYIIKKEKINLGMSLSSTLVQGSNFLGILSAPFCIALIGLSGGIIVDAVTFIICGLVIITLKYKDTSLKEEKVSFKCGLIDLKEGFLFLKNNKVSKNICIFSAIANALFIPLNALAPAYINKLDLGAEGLTLVEGLILIGMALGGILYPKVSSKIKGKNLFIGSGILFGTCAVVFSFLNYVTMVRVWIVIIALIMGIAIIHINIPISTAAVTKIEDKFIPRFNGIRQAVVLSISPVTSFISGIMVKFISVESIFLILGIASILLFIMQKYNKILNLLS